MERQQQKSVEITMSNGIIKSRNPLGEAGVIHGESDFFFKQIQRVVQNPKARKSCYQDQKGSARTDAEQAK